MGEELLVYKINMFILHPDCPVISAIYKHKGGEQNYCLKRLSSKNYKYKQESINHGPEICH